MKTIKLCIIGDNDVGKTSFVSRLANGQFENNKDYSSFKFGNIRFEIVDLKHADCAILMFDVTNQSSYDNLSMEGLIVPTLLIGNKIDLTNSRVVSVDKILFHRQHNLKYYEMSAKSCYNIDKPLLWACDTMSVQCCDEIVVMESGLKIDMCV